MRGGCCAAVSAAWRLVRGRRSSRPCAISASSSSTRSTRRATRTARRRAITRATSRWCARGWRGARVVLGSATPSLESQAQARAGRFGCFACPIASSSGRCRRWSSSTCATPPLVLEAAPVPWSEALDAAPWRRARQQGAGAAAAQPARAMPRSCSASPARAVAGCPNCSIALTVHRAPEGLRCHYCDHREPMPARCAAVRRRGARGARRRYPAARAAGGRALSRGARRAHGPRHHRRQGGAPAHPRRRGQRRRGHPARHPDDREGTGLSRG